MYHDRNHLKNPLYTENLGQMCKMEVLPLPDRATCPYKVNYPEHVDEPKFDPKVHLQLEKPEFVRVFPNMEKAEKAPKISGLKSSSFGYSSPFQLLSDEGIRVLSEIIAKEESRAFSDERGSKRILRGLYYNSPFIRDLQNCQEILDLYEELIGEPVIPNICFSSSPQVNLSSPGSAEAIDQWHNDSICYAGVIILSDMTDMKGGDLELFMGSKEEGMDLLCKGGIPKERTEVVSYENPGKMIITHGCEVLHHVTPVTSDHIRTTMIFALSPANCFRPPMTICQTFVKVEKVTLIGYYEFFREKSWILSHALKHYAEKTSFDADGKELAKKLRSVQFELSRVINLLEGVESDAIRYFDEKNKKVEIYEKKG